LQLRLARRRRDDQKGGCPTMATQLLRAPEKGARQQELIDDQQLELRTQMAAHYLQTDHDTDGGRLIQGQVDHTLLVGHRVRTSTEELEKLRLEFGTDQLQLEKCPVCQRSVTHGEFGVDHVRSRRPTSVPSLQYDSYPSHDAVGGFFFEFEADRDAPRRSCSTLKVMRSGKPGKFALHLGSGAVRVPRLTLKGTKNLTYGVVMKKH
jgi:hypothetical protein